MISPSQPKQSRLQSPQLEIRRMRGPDVSQVMEIESVSFGRHHWSEESFYNEMNNHVGRYYSLVQTETQADSPGLLGYCGFWMILDEAHITTIAVRPEFRGNALGELLLLHTLERSMSSSIHWATLEVRASNYNAQNLYYKYGFNSMGVRPRYYQDNQEDALIMTTADICSADYRAQFQQLKLALKQRLNGLPKGYGV